MTSRFSIRVDSVGKMLSLEQAFKVLLKLTVIGCGGGMARNDYYIMPPVQRFSVGSENLAYAAAQQIAHHGVAQPFRCNNPEAGFLCACTLAGIGEGAEHKKTPCCG